MSDRPYIICIDDERIILDAFKEQVKLKFGDKYNVGLAESADEALMFFSELINQGDLVPIVICDYLMPKIKGDELLCRIREICSDTVMVLLTGQADLSGIKNAVNNAGIFKYIAKPWVKEDLYLIIEEALDYFYNNIKYKENHIKLKETNNYLRDALESKTEELKRRNNIHISVEKAKQSSEAVRRMTDEVKESLVLIKSGIETMKKLKSGIGIEENEKLVSYITSFDDYFSNIINSMNQLAYTVVENSDEMKIETDTSDRFNDVLDKSNSVRAGILESINELTDRISRIEKLFKKDIKKLLHGMMKKYYCLTWMRFCFLQVRTEIYLQPQKRVSIELERIYPN